GPSSGPAASSAVVLQVDAWRRVRTGDLPVKLNPLLGTWSCRLLEEERNTEGPATVPQVTRPRMIHWPPPWARLAADDYPVDAGEVQGGQRAEQGLRADEPDSGRDLAQGVGPVDESVVLDADAKPDVRITLAPVSRQMIGDAFVPLGED